MCAISVALTKNPLIQLNVLFAAAIMGSTGIIYRLEVNMTDQHNGFNNQAHGEQPQQPAAASAHNQHPAGPQKTNTMAIVGLVLAFIAAPIGAIISFVALGQIKKTGEGGRGLALAGAILGTLFTVFFILVIIFSIVVASKAAEEANKTYSNSSSSSSSGSSSGSSSSGSSTPSDDDVDQAICDSFTKIAGSQDPAELSTALAELAVLYSDGDDDDDPAKLKVVNDFKAAVDSLDTSTITTTATEFDTVLRDDQFACLSR